MVQKVVGEKNGIASILVMGNHDHENMLNFDLRNKKKLKFMNSNSKMEVFQVKKILMIGWRLLMNSILKSKRK